MMSAGQPINDGLEARQVRFDTQVNREPALNSAWETAGWDGKLGSLGRIDQITTTPKAASAPSHEIKIDERHRVLASTASRYSQGIRAGPILGALVASSGLAWIVICGLPSPFGLTWVGGSNGDRIPDPNAASSSLSGQSPTSSAGIPESKSETDREAAVKAPDSPKLSSSSASSRGQPSLGAAPLTPSATKVSTVAQQHKTSIEPRAGNLQTRTQLAPTPETRPTTIEGWTLREVINGTAVLDGPNGIWRATRGDSVPGVGRVDSIIRWGNRWVVATSRGLISTP
jgi:hypothetical protein